MKSGWQSGFSLTIARLVTRARTVGLQNCSFVFDASAASDVNALKQRTWGDAVDVGRAVIRERGLKHVLFCECELNSC